MAEHNELYQRAHYYDIALQRNVSAEVEFIQQLFQRYAGRPLASVIDIACGPGYHARQFARNGVRAVGLDLRPEMIEYAQDQARAEGLNIQWLVGDMRFFLLDQPVDAAMTMYDSLDALHRNEDLVRHLQAISQNLSEKGIYIVDLTHPRDVGYCHYSNYHYQGSRDGVEVEVIWATNAPRYDLVTGVAYTELEIHVNDHGEKKVFRDLAEERLLYPQELILLGELSGCMKVVGWYGDYSLDQPLDDSPDSRRLIAVYQKEC